MSALAVFLLRACAGNVLAHHHDFGNQLSVNTLCPLFTYFAVEDNLKVRINY